MAAPAAKVGWPKRACVIPKTRGAQVTLESGRNPDCSRSNPFAGSNCLVRLFLQQDSRLHTSRHALVFCPVFGLMNFAQFENEEPPPALFPDLVWEGETFWDICTLSPHEGALIVVYEARGGFCGFVVQPDQKPKFLQDNGGVTERLESLAAEWERWSARLLEAFIASREFLSRPNVEIVSFNVSYRRRKRASAELREEPSYHRFRINTQVWDEYLRER